MSRILYIGNDYCRTLEQLQGYFRTVTSAEDPLYQELLTLQLDGLIAEWLQEGSEEEKVLAEKIRNLSPSLSNRDNRPSSWKDLKDFFSPSLSNRDLMEKLGKLMTNQNTLYNVNLLSYVELKEVAFALVDDSTKEIKFKKVVKDENISLEENNLKKMLRLRLTFKVVKSEKEVFRLKTSLSLKGVKVEETENELRLNNEPVAKEGVLEINVPLWRVKKDAEDSYLLEISDESQILFTAQVSLGGGRKFNVNGVEFKMIHIEDGTFEMDSNYHVTLSSYYIGETQVTQELWQAVMGNNPSSFKEAQNPVENVSWSDCQKFIEKLNQKTDRRFRLPTEAEWEFAARGGTKSNGYSYSGSNSLNDVAWYDSNSGRKTHPVKQKKPNELGIYDMSGNVWEWCLDWWGGYSSSAQTNPQGPSSGSYRVLRGGSWFDVAEYCRVACRSGDSPDYRYYDIGFRLALVHK